MLANAAWPMAVLPVPHSSAKPLVTAPRLKLREAALDPGLSLDRRCEGGDGRR